MSSTESLEAQGAAPGRRSGPGIEPHPWGYSLRNLGHVRQGSHLAGIGKACGGMAFLMAALALIAIPSSIEASEVIGMKLGVVALFVVAGGALIWAGARGPEFEAQVDLGQRRVRIGQRRRRGIFTLQGSLEFRTISGVHVRRADTPGAPWVLCLEIAGSDLPFELACGRPETLEPIRRKLTEDIVGQPKRRARTRRPEIPGLAAEATAPVAQPAAAPPSERRAAIPGVVELAAYQSGNR